MKKSFYLVIAISIILFAACGGKKDMKENPEAQGNDSTAFADDETIYGLACEGTTDSVVWLLPLDASDPIKFDILNAHLSHKVFGKIKTGDNIAVVVNPGDSTVADMVIDIEQLKGTWCYVVMPTLKDADKMTKREQAEILRHMPDSVKDILFVPREYGFTLKRNNQASPVGMVIQTGTQEEESPVVYAEVARYSSWHILNGKLVLTQKTSQMPAEPQDTIAEGDENAPQTINRQVVKNDTADIVFMLGDSLVLQFGKQKQSYYRVSSASEANKLAREQAEKNAKEAAKKLTETSSEE